MVSSCEVCDQYEKQLQQVYEELASAKTESRGNGDEAQRKLNRLLSVKHSHQAKQGCLRQGK